MAAGTRQATTAKRRIGTSAFDGADSGPVGTNLRIATKVTGLKITKGRCNDVTF
jgi:hypothetical protein